MKRLLTDHHRLILSLIPPFLALGLQTWLWEDLKPHAWLLFYPATFFSAWLGGPRGGVAATLLSLGLNAGFPGAPDPTLEGAARLPAMAVFACMGFLFAGFHARLQAQAQALREMADSERRFRTLFEEAPLGMSLTDSRTRETIEVNPRFAEIVGRSSAELKSIDWKDITEPEDARKDLENMARLNAGEIGGFRMDKRFLRPDGAVAWVAMTVAPLNVDPEASPRHLCMIEDITERLALQRESNAALQRLNLVNAAAGIGVWDWDLRDGSLAWDDTLCEFYGVSPEERHHGLSYETWRSRVHPEDLEHTETLFQEAIRHRASFDHIFRIVRADGALRWVHAASVIEPDAAGQPLRMIGINQDVTAWHEQQQALIEARAEAARHASEQRLGALIEQGLAGIAEADAAGRLLKVNDRYCEIVGHPRQALLGKPFCDGAHPDAPSLMTPLLEGLIQTGQPRLFEMRCRGQDGRERWAGVSLGRVPGKPGQEDTFLALVVDIDACKQSEERLRLALEASGMGIYDWDLVTGRIIWSREHERLFGYQPGEFDGSYEHFTRRVHPDDLAEVTAELESSRQTRQPYRCEYRLIWPDGSVHWVKGLGEYHYNTAGEAERMRGAVVDITARKLTELDLVEQKRLLAEAQHLAHLGSWSSTLDGGLMQWSEETYRLWGVTPESFKPSLDSLLELVFPQDRAKLRTLFTDCLAGKPPAPHILRRFLPDGRLRYLAGQTSLQYDAQSQPTHVSGSLQDVTETYRAEEQLRESERRFRELFEHLPIPYQSLDTTGRWLDLNPPMAALLGFDRPEDMLGLNFADYWDDSIKDRFQAHFDEFKLRSRTEGELLLRRRDGCPIIVQIAGQVQRDPQGHFQRTHCILLDITERRALETEILALNADLEMKVQQRTAQLQAATEAKSQFLASMSHEIRTPMNGVLGLAQMLEQEDLSPEQMEMVQRIRAAGRSLLGIINDILDFSKIEAGQLELEDQVFGLAEVLKHIDNLLGASARQKGLTFHTDAPPLRGRLVGDSLRLEQVLINLVGNAIKFTEQGEVTLRVKPVEINESQARLRFEVRDTGIGMTPEVRARLFQPFAQAEAGTARRFGGTGLGLSISKRLVELMGGEIGAESRPDFGSTFWLELPFQRGEDTAPAATVQTPKAQGPRLAGLHLLVADDNQINLYLAERALKKEGARVTLVKDGQQALDRLRENPAGFDAVLMDIQMPIMNGLEATRAIRTELELTDLPVIALSAAVMTEERQEALDAGVNDFLPKPMDLNQMADIIRLYCPT